MLPPPRGLPLGNSSRFLSCEFSDCRNEPSCLVFVHSGKTTMSGPCPFCRLDVVELAKSSTTTLEPQEIDLSMSGFAS